MDSTDLSKSGRLYGGCAIVWKNFLPFNVKIIENQCKRVCPIALNYNNNDYLLISVYMPVNNN